MKKTTFIQDESAVWLKGNIHAHSTCSDGHLTPERLVEGFKERGYDFLAITDHDVFFSHQDLNREDFLLLPGMELTAPLNLEDRKFAHLGILQRGEKGSIEEGQSYKLTTKEEVVDFIEKHHEEYMVILNHPNWSLLDWNDVIDVPHISAVEIYNHSCALGCLNGDSTYFWLNMFRKGRRMSIVAADDCHNVGENVPGWPFEAINCDAFGGFVGVKAKARTREAIIEAIETGSCYASNGPQIHDFYIEDDRFYVKCSPCLMILISGDFGCYQRTFGKGITEFSGKLRGRENFVRVQCIDEKGRMASSNPIFIKDILKKENNSRGEGKMSKEMKLSEDRKNFRILSFTDTHIDDWADRAVYTWKAIEETIKAEQPDLVTFVGDNVTGGDNRQRLEDFCDNLDKLGIPWCPVLGNHEGDNPISVRRNTMVERFAASELCLVEAEKKFLENGEAVEGEGNTVLHIRNDKNEIVTTMFFLDTGSDLEEEEKLKYGFPVEKSKDGFLRESQIAWYKEELAKRNSSAPVIVFGHYPLMEMKEAYELATEHDTKYEAGAERKTIGADGEEKTAKWLFGYRREGICAQTVNTGLFKAMRDSGIKHTYITGHDHVNDFRVEYQGVTLIYNAPGSYSSYNVLSKGEKITVGRTDKLLQGCNLITIGEDGKMDVEYINYADRYPEMQEGVMKVIRLK